MNEKYEKAIEMLMKDRGFVYYEDEWVPASEAYWKSSQNQSELDQPKQE